MSDLTMCGYCCDLCKAYRLNIEKDDKRNELAKAWKKYYELDIPAADIYCDGCRCQKSHAKLLDSSCPVRNCVTQHNIRHCGECDKYPCDTFSQREGLTEKAAREKVNSDFDLSEYNEYLLAYDNKTQIGDYNKNGSQ